MSLRSRGNAPRARHAQWRGVALNDHTIFLHDLGAPWDVYPTITNDAERVIEILFGKGALRHYGRHVRVFYADSEGEVTELVHDGTRFTGFGIPGIMCAAL